MTLIFSKHKSIMHDVYVNSFRDTFSQDPYIFVLLDTFLGKIKFVDDNYCYLNGNHSYLSLLASFINGLYYFTISFDLSDLRKKHFISSYVFSVDLYFIVNDYKNQTILFSYMLNGEDEREDTDEVRSIYKFLFEGKDDEKLDSADFIINWVLERQRKIEANPSTKDHISYLKYSYEEFAKEFIPLFEENIYDIPKDSILWETPLLKETMANYEALKKYAEERGWA